MRTLTVEKIGETEKAVQYRVTFWIVENPGHPVCWERKRVLLWEVAAEACGHSY